MHHDEDALVAAAQRRRIQLTSMGDYRIETSGPPTLLLGYAQNPEPTIRAAVTELAEAINATGRAGSR
jgi:DNA-binding transcriptional MocR family regulator